MNLTKKVFDRQLNSYKKKYPILVLRIRSIKGQNYGIT